MIEDFRQIENCYIEIFSQRAENNDKIKFFDNKLPDMYNFNLILLKDNIREYSIEDKVVRLLNQAKEEDREFLKIILHPNIRLDESMKDFFKNIGFEVGTNLYMKLAKNNTDLFKGNMDCIVRRASSKEDFDDVERLDVEVSVKAGMSLDFSRRKAFRKKEIFYNKDNNLSIYLCYHDDKIIGKCEFYIKDNYCKIEDFDVLDIYQRKGYGTAILEKLISDAIDLGKENIYLMAEKEDTPKEMYKKLGFEVIGEETVLFLNLN